MAKKSRVSKIKKQLSDNARVIAAAVILIVLILIIIFSKNLVNYTPKQADAVAIINGEVITKNEFNTLYSRVPDMYKMTGMTEEVFLQDTLVPQRLLIQEAVKQGITVNDSEIQEMVDEVLTMSEFTIEDFEDQLAQQNLTLDEFKSLTKEQVMITKLLNQTMDSVEVSDQEIKDFYDNNKEYFATGNETYQELSEVEEGIKQYLANQKYIEELTSKADIQILLEQDTGSISDLAVNNAKNPKSPGSSFTETSDEICTEDGKPIIILFSTTTCPHCKWIKSTFDSVAESYGSSIAAYHWELDTKDNTLTSSIENVIPDEHLKMFIDNSPKGGVPTYVFGCKYYRVGNAYETNNDLDAETQDFKTVIDSLLQ